MMKNWKQIAVCLVVAAAAYGGWNWYKAEQAGNGAGGAPAMNGGARPGGAAALVVAEPARKQVVNDKLSAIGSGVARNTVALSPYSSGTIRRFLVTAGMHVQKDQLIAELDAETEQIALEKAQVLLKDAENTQQRMTTLRASNTATQVQVVAAELALANARLAVKDAQLALSRRSVTAPIAGIVGILPVDAGNYVTSATTIATIDDRSKLLIDIFVPERFAPQLRVGQAVSAIPTALPGQSFSGEISAVDNMIDPASRTLRVRAEITNPSDVLRAGMSFTVTILFPGDDYIAVDPLSIQWDGDGSYVWRIDENNKAERVSVRIIQRNASAVLVNGTLTEGDIIVTEGVQNVREGGTVEIKNQNTGNAATDKEPVAAQNEQQAG